MYGSAHEKASLEERAGVDGRYSVTSRETIAVSGLLGLTLYVSVSAVGEEVAQQGNTTQAHAGLRVLQLRPSPVLLGDILLDFLLP